jgi:hypothetical protein
MKTLISKTNNKAVYEFSYGDNKKTVEFESIESGADFEKVATEEHKSWLKWLGVSE